jgi:hypothetical protein
LQVELGASLRFFWNQTTFVVQAKSGTTLEFGVPLDGHYDSVNGVDRDKLPAGEGSALNPPFRWKLVRQYDANVLTSGEPANPVIHTYNSDGTLGDVYDTPPPGQPWPDLSTYAHHTHLRYESYPYYRHPAPAMWRRTPQERLTGVDVTSAPFQSTGARELVRRYHLTYQDAYHHSYLQTFQEEGRCKSIVREGTDGLLGSTRCDTLPAVQLTYSDTTPNFGVDPLSLNVTAKLTDTNFWIGDLNSDSLPDFIVAGTAPAPPPPAEAPPQTLFLNSINGVRDSFIPADLPIVTALSGLGEDTTNLMRIGRPQPFLVGFARSRVISQGTVGWGSTGLARNRGQVIRKKVSSWKA